MGQEAGRGPQGDAVAQTGGGQYSGQTGSRKQGVRSSGGPCAWGQVRAVGRLMGDGHSRAEESQGVGGRELEDGLWEPPATPAVWRDLCQIPRHV